MKIKIVLLIVLVSGELFCASAQEVGGPNNGFDNGIDTQLKINREVLLKGSDEQMRIDSAVVMLVSEDAAARGILLDTLAKKDNPSAILAICKAMSQVRLSGDPGAILNKSEFVEPLVKVLVEGDAATAKVAAEALLIFEYDRMSEILNAVLGDDKVSVESKLNVIEALRLQPDMDAILKLIDLLESPEAKIAEASGTALRLLAIPVGADAQSRQDIVSELKNKGVERFQRDRLMRQDDRIRKLEQDVEFWRQRYLGSLDRVYDVLSDEAGRGGFLAEHLKSDERSVKLWALNKVYEWRQSTNPKLPASLGPVLAGLISDPDAEVRLKTASLLSLMGELNTAEKLLEQLKVETDGEVRTELLIALGQACYYAFLPDSGIKISKDVRDQTLGWALKYLENENENLSRPGAEIIKKLIEQDGLTDKEADKYLAALVSRYRVSVEKSQSGLRGELLNAMAALCAQGVHKARAAKLYEPLFVEAISDESELVRESAVEGLIYIDKANAIKRFRKALAAESSAKIRERLIGLAEEVGGAEDLDWLSERLSDEAERPLAWKAMQRIFKDVAGDVSLGWVGKLETLNAAGSLGDDQFVLFLENTEKKLAAEKKNGDLKGIRQKLAELYSKAGKYEQAAKYYALVLPAAANEKERESVLANLVTSYLKLGNWKSAAQVLTNVLQQKDFAEGSAVLGAIDGYLAAVPKGADVKGLLKELLAIKAAERPVWNKYLSQWCAKFGVDIAPPQASAPAAETQVAGK